MWVAVGMAAAAGVGAIASSNASKNASDASKTNTESTLALQASMYDQQREDLNPYRQIGLDALPEYKRIMSGEEMKLSAPGQWQLEQSAKYMGRADAARGLSGSGGAVSRAGEMGRKVYAQDYNDQYNRIMQSLGIGQSAAAGTVQASQNQQANIGSANALNQANILDQGQSQANLYSGIGGVATRLAGLYGKQPQPPVASSLTAPSAPAKNFNTGAGYSLWKG